MLIKLIFISTTTTAFICGRRKQQQKHVRKGWFAMKFGETGGEQQRFVEAEDEYGLEQMGTITIP
ncbi:hypothetical protein Hanom_Chr07g00664771 [Helianthus anomalus]